MNRRATDPTGANPGDSRGHNARGGRIDLFVEHVTNVDCGVLDADRGLVGTTWLVDATLSGTLDDNGMLFDFGPARKALKSGIDARIDHRLLVPSGAAGLTQKNGPNGDLTFVTDTGECIEYSGPDTAIAIIDAPAITCAVLEASLQTELLKALPANVTGLELHLRDEAVEGAAYTYCHGLRTHDGDCQRLAHGHRSRLAIEVDGIDNPPQAEAWARQWCDIFIGHRADLQTPESDARYRFAYRAAQGDFSLTLDAARCVLLDGPATVENIAAHIAGELGGTEPARQFTVRAYEGVGKGAIARSPNA